MTINLSDNSPRVIYTVAAGVTQSSFTVPFDFFEEGDVNVYVDGVLKTITTDYTVSGGSGTGGTVAMSVTGISGSSSVVLTRDLTLERTTDFPTSGPFDVTSLNTELDRFTAVSADLKDQVDRALQLTDYDADANLTLPDLNSRKGKVLAFDAVTGDLVNGPSTAGVTTIAAAAADIATLADIQDGTVATNAITDAAAIKTNITTVANIASNVTTVAGNTANINTVSGNTSNINTVAGIDSDVTTVSGIAANVTTAAGISADITAVAADATDIGTVSANIANVNSVAAIDSDVTTVAGMSSADITTVAGISANVTTVAGIDADVTTVAGIAADVTAAATNVADIQAISTAIADVITVANDLNEATSEIDVVANNIANVNAVGTDIANVNTVASNLADVNAFAETYFISATAPSSPTQGDLWFDTDPAALLMKVYDGSGWVNAGSSVNGTSQRVTYTATAGQTTFAATYDAGFVDVYLNGIKLIDGTDFTATSGTSIVLASGAALNDTVDIVAYGTFTLLSTVLDDLSDVSTAGATSGQVLSYNGASWSASTPSVPTLSSLGIANHDQVTVDGSGNVDVTGSIEVGDGHTIGDDANDNLTLTSSTGENIKLDSAGGTTLFLENGSEVARISSGKVGIGTSSPSMKLHIAEGSSGVSSFNASADDLLIERNSNAGLTIASPNTNSGNIAFADPQSANAGLLQYNHSSNYMGFWTNAGERLRIDSSGRVTMPYQPSFWAYHSSDLPYNTVSSPIVYNTVEYNIGNHYNSSTGQFTAPISGRYLINAYAMYMDETSFTFIFIVPNVNGTGVHEFMTTGRQQYNSHGGSMILNLSANDILDVRPGLSNVDAGYFRGGKSFNMFQAQLLG